MYQFKTFRPGEDATEIYRLRYEINETEMGVEDDYTDHTRQTIADPLDDFAYNVAAYRDGKIVGASRVNFCADGDAGYYLDYYELESVGDDYPDKTSLTTRFMSAKSERGTPLPAMLVAECFKHGVERGVYWSFCDCDPAVLPFFLKLGFEVHNPNKPHRNYGPGAIIFIDLRKPIHFDRRKSLLGRYLNDYKAH